MSCYKNQKGFALLEVMVAVGIIATAAVALLTRMQSISNTTIFLEERTTAHWIADNIMQEKLVDHTLQGNIERIRRDKDQLEYAGRNWHWNAIVEEVPLPEVLGDQKMFRIDIEVGLDPEKPMALLSGYVNE